MSQEFQPHERITPHDAVVERIYNEGRQLGFNTSLLTLRVMNAALLAVGNAVTREAFVDLCGKVFDQQQRLVEHDAAKYVDAHRRQIAMFDPQEEE